MLQINTIRTKTVVDLRDNNIQPVKSIDLDTTYFKEVPEIHKEALGIEDENIIVDYDNLPETPKKVGQMVRVGGKIYVWEEET